MTVYCASLACRKMIDSSWHFCPYCGTDNRPPNLRKSVPLHQHEFIHNQGACVWCGEESGEPYDFSTRKRKVIGRLLFWVGVTVMGLVIYMILVRFHVPLPLSGWIDSWWSRTSFFRVRIFFMRTHQIGPTLCFYLTILGVILMVCGVWIFRKRKIPDLGDFLD